LAGGKQSALAANTGGGGTMPADSDCCRPAAMSVVGT